MPAPILVCLLRHGADDAVVDVAAALPPTVDDHPVHAVVVHAGSLDGGVADAPVDALGVASGSGLGALARAGLAAGAHHQAAAVVLLDPSGEYDGGQLADVVRPVLRGDADYVVGSRFADGRPRAMARRRRAGNRVLTAWVRRNTRVEVTDGQSGFRALSAPAAAAAEVIHDFNHAQVLTLDLVAKGFRYEEVPVSFAARPRGSSWVRVGPYLRQVRRGVRRQLRTTSEVTAFGPPLDLSADPSDLVSPEPTIDVRDRDLTAETDSEPIARSTTLVP